MTLPETSYRTIPLTHGQVAIVDASDYEVLSQWKWHAQWNETTKSYYATRNYQGSDGVIHRVAMHRALLFLGTVEPRQSDHRNGNTLDNRRANLRVATHAENMRNRTMYKTNKSGFKGVYFRKGRKDKPWRANIQKEKQRFNLGYFASPEEAHAAYIDAAKRLFGEFARIA